MASIITFGLLALLLYFVYSYYSRLRKNISEAKLSGLPYVVTPIHVYNRLWLITCRLWLPLLRKLPKRWRGDWLELMNPDWCFKRLYEPFARYGDTFITASPSRNIIWTASPESIHQISQLRDNFPKPLESYKLLDLFGRSVVTVEGIEWRKHRKVIAPSFNEKNNALVFKESVAQAQVMLKKWTGIDGKGSRTLVEIPTDTMRVALHIISMVGFGVRLLWPGEQLSEKERASGFHYASHEIPEGHTLSFERALSSLLENIVWILLLPEWLLKRLPSKHANLAYESYVNWGQYMREIYEQRVMDVRTGARGVEGMDIMGSLVKNTLGEQPQDDTSKASISRAEKGQTGGFTETEIFGNSFIMILAGHETTANTIHFALIELATNSGSQRRVQEEVDNIFSGSAPKDWDYESCINTCLGGMLGAVLNETLRVMPPVVTIPKSVRPDQGQSIMVDGKKVMLPKGCLINFDTVAVHRNPKYWPSLGASRISGRPDDLDDFIPERWLVKGHSKDSKEVETCREPEEEIYGGFTGADTAEQLFRPARSAFIPFSNGSRSCLGRRLAQIEVVVVLAVVFQYYSIELAVDEWATDEEVAKMSDNEKVELYKKAQEQARKTINTATTRITLKLHDAPGYVPVRIVRRGEERFLHLLE